MTLKFYSNRGPNGYLSNFFGAIFEVQGIQYPSVEHFYQSMKSDDPAVQLQIRSALTPGIAKRWGGQIECRPDWEDEVGTPALREMFRDQHGYMLDLTKDHMMFMGLTHKFSQRRELRSKLLDTGDVELIENAPKDAYWGSGKNGTGLNKLGRMLMFIRARERSEVPSMK
jgi:ribA/ribD-fused uncharacterized protein